eukprot:PhM_4_TR5332/c0_g1_i1/m.46243
MLRLDDSRPSTANRPVSAASSSSSNYTTTYNKLPSRTVSFTAGTFGTSAAAVVDTPKSTDLEQPGTQHQPPQQQKQRSSILLQHAHHHSHYAMDPDAEARAAARALSSLSDLSHNDGRDPATIPNQSVLDLRADWDIKTHLARAHRRAVECLMELELNLKPHIRALENEMMDILERLAATRYRVGVQEQVALSRRRTELEERQALASRIDLRSSELREDLSTHSSEQLTDAMVELLGNLCAQIRALDWKRAVDLSTVTSLLQDDLSEEIRIPRQTLMESSDVDVKLRTKFTLKGLRIRCAALDPDAGTNAWLYIGTEEGRACCVSLVDGSIVQEFHGHHYPITCISVSYVRGTKYLMTGGMDKTVRMFRIIESPSRADGEDAAASCDLKCIFAEHRGVISGVAAEGGASGSIFTSSYDKTVMLWTVRHGLSDGVAFTAPAPIHGIHVEGTRLSVGCRDGTVVLLTIDGRRCFFEHIFAREPTQIEWATFADAERTRLRSYIAQKRVTWGSHTNAVGCIAEAQSFLFTGGDDGRIIQWDLLTKTRVRCLHEHVDIVTAMHVTREGLLFSSSFDATIVISNIKDGERLHTLRPHYHRITGLMVATLPHTAGNAGRLDLSGIDAGSTKEQQSADAGPQSAASVSSMPRASVVLGSSGMGLGRAASPDDITSWSEDPAMLVQGGGAGGGLSFNSAVLSSFGGAGTSPTMMNSARRGSSQENTQGLLLSSDGPPTATTTSTGRRAQYQTTQMISVCFDRTICIHDVKTLAIVGGMSTSSTVPPPQAVPPAQSKAGVVKTSSATQSSPRLNSSSSTLRRTGSKRGSRKSLR